MTTLLSPNQKARALDLQSRGRTPRLIADELEVDPKRLARWLLRHNAREWARLERRTAAERFRQIEILRHLTGEMLAAWYASKRPAATVKRTLGDEARQKAERTVKREDGNPSFSAEARACLADIRKLLRIDRADEDDDAAAATALAAVFAALDSALGVLPEDLREPLREQLAGSLLELARRDR
jgi:hypothetical protein